MQQSVKLPRHLAERLVAMSARATTLETTTRPIVRSTLVPISLPVKRKMMDLAEAINVFSLGCIPLQNPTDFDRFLF